MSRNSVIRLAMLASLAVLTACDRDDKPDAFGSFEATEIVVGSQTAGPIESFAATEGASLGVGAVVAVIDTSALVLDERQLGAQRAAVTSRQGELTEQARVLEVQREIVQRVYDRTKRLHDQQAATAQQLDQAERELRTLVAQLAAVRASQRSVSMEAGAVDARIAQARLRIARARVLNPRAGTVLATYARAGEMVAAGQPLYKIASLDTLDLRAYISAAQLANVRIGQAVTVHIDRGPDSLQALPGVISWIATQGEFTPTPVQTRDERTDLVYAIKIRVANPDGALKIGMPADVSFGQRVATR